MFSVLSWKRSELGVVVGVLVFIFGISFYQVKLGEMKTRDAQRKSDVEMVARGLRKYFADYGIYPAEATGSGRIVACGYMGRDTCEWGGGQVVDVDGVTYINKLPDDPLSGKGYKYIYRPAADRQSFRIYVGLENRADKDFKTDLNVWCGEVRCRWYVE
jgi:hypothetical protein